MQRSMCMEGGEVEAEMAYICGGSEGLFKLMTGMHGRQRLGALNKQAVWVLMDESYPGRHSRHWFGV